MPERMTREQSMACLQWLDEQFVAQLAACSQDQRETWKRHVEAVRSAMDAIEGNEKLRDAAERAVEWFGRFAAEPEDTTVMHELQAALGQTVEHDPMRCRCET